MYFINNYICSFCSWLELKRDSINFFFSSSVFTELISSITSSNNYNSVFSLSFSINIANYIIIIVEVINLINNKINFENFKYSNSETFVINYYINFVNCNEQRKFD